MKTIQFQNENNLNPFTLAKDAITSNDQFKEPETKIFAGNQVPSVELLSKVVRKLRLNKAVGPDGIPAEILRVGGEAFIAKLQDLLRWIWEKAYVPIAWRGGRIVELAKKM